MCFTSDTVLEDMRDVKQYPSGESEAGGTLHILVRCGEHFSSSKDAIEKALFSFKSLIRKRDEASKVQVLCSQAK